MSMNIHRPPPSKRSASTAAPLTACMALLVAISGCGGSASAPPSTSAPPSAPFSAPPSAPTLARSLAPVRIQASGSDDRYESGAPDDYYMTGGEWEQGNGNGNGADIAGDGVELFYSGGLRMLHKRIETCAGKTIADKRCLTTEARVDVNEAPRDVRAAWRDGWTGSGMNILIIDSFGLPDRVEGELFASNHGYSVTMSAREIAPRATYYAMSAGFNEGAEEEAIYNTQYREGDVRNIRDDSQADRAATEFHVINMSFGTMAFCGLSTGISCQSLTESEINDRALSYRNTSSALFADLNGGAYLPNAGDAVITTSAGNQEFDAGFISSTLALLMDDGIGTRLLIVGALDGYAQDAGADLADYSNYAGDNPDVQARFLVEYGGSPFAEDVVGWDSEAGSSYIPPFAGPGSIGTSFAAPRVAGHAALLRHKFPNLSGPVTSDIMLDTATYQGLVCAPNCRVDRYGQGRVDIGRALAPIGPLR